MNKNITAIVFARNELRRLPYVIDNLKGFCEIIVCDGGSTDGTLDYCNKNNIKYVVRPEFRPREANMEKNMMLDFSKDFINTISNMVLSDKRILTFIVVSFLIYISVALTVMSFRF